MSSLISHRWYRGGDFKDWDTLNRRLGELEVVLSRLHERAEGGPLPGAYFPISIHRPGTVATGTAVWSLVLPIEMRPILLTVGVGGGEATIDYNEDGNSVLTTPLATSSGVATIRARSDFVVEKLAAGAVHSLDIDAVSGTPVNLSIIAVFKHLGKVEEA